MNRRTILNYNTRWSRADRAVAADDLDRLAALFDDLTVGTLDGPCQKWAWLASNGVRIAQYEPGRILWKPEAAPHNAFPMERPDMGFTHYWPLSRRRTFATRRRLAVA